MIKTFQGPNRFLSNFYPAPITLRSGEAFPTAEHLYQASKVADPFVREEIRLAATPGRARRMGSQARLVTGWEDHKLEVMRAALILKFDQNPDLQERLFQTGDQELQEGNSWGDTFWGVCDGVGENHLGKLLMELRSSLKEA